jgi:glycerol-3-phosphate O-acyltransferase
MNLESIESIVLSYPKLHQRIDGRSDVRKKALKLLYEIKADYSKAGIKATSKFLGMALKRLYDDVQITTPEGVDLQQMVQDSNVVFVPNHQSHADYIALNHTLYHDYNLPVHIAGGVNLNIFPIGTIFRKSGCFFIRRSFVSDILYKLTLEAYLYYLLIKGYPIEFFFEGGRSRTGKLLSPRYGLYQMLLEAHSYIPDGMRRELKFVPVSIAHEYLAEQKSMAGEVKGKKKKKESSGQLIKLLGLVARQFGSVHLRFGKPVDSIPFNNPEELKKVTQDLAFQCFRVVGRNMVVTPTAILSMILLDEPVGAIKFKDILVKVRAVVSYCQQFDVPLSRTLEWDRIEETIRQGLKLLISNGQVEIIGKKRQSHNFYSIKTEARSELLYYKNSILHHFLVPSIMNIAGINIFNGTISDVEGMRKLLITQRNQLKYEFYLPRVKAMQQQALQIISGCVGKSVRNIVEGMELSHRELYTLVSHISVFANSCTYISAGYYLTAKSLKELANEHEQQFTLEQFNARCEELFHFEMELGRVIHYPESFSPPIIKNSLKYFENMDLIKRELDSFRVVQPEELAQVVKQYERQLTEQLTFSTGLS